MESKLPIAGYPHLSLAAQPDLALRARHLVALRAKGFAVQHGHLVPPKDADGRQVIVAITAAFQEARRT